MAAMLALANISAVSAAALVQQREQGTEKPITIVLQVSRKTKEKAIDVWGQDQKVLLAQSCSDSLQSRPVEHDAIVFQAAKE